MLQNIKGNCEHCGLAYKGKADITRDVICPQCGEVTQNHDDAKTIDYLESVEGYHLKYQEFKLITK